MCVPTAQLAAHFRDVGYSTERHLTDWSAHRPAESTAEHSLGPSVPTSTRTLRTLDTAGIPTGRWLTLFCKAMSLELAARTWDCFLFEGELFMYRCSIGEYTVCARMRLCVCCARERACVCASPCAAT